MNDYNDPDSEPKVNSTTLNNSGFVCESGVILLKQLSFCYSRMFHTLLCERQDKRARDAFVEDEDTFEIFDPRNPINKRRREASKKTMKDKRR